MKKWLLSLCMILALAACDDKKETAQADTKPVVKIGATLPLSGDLSYVGNGAQNALTMLLEKWQKVDTKYTYQLVFEDDMAKSQQAAINTRKFIDVNKANAIISIFGIVDRVVDDIANQNKIISLSCSYGKDNVPQYGFNTSPQNEEIYASVVKELKKNGAKNVALLGSNAAVSNVLLGYAAEHFPYDGIEVVFDERYNVGETDFRLSIQKMEQKTPDYYVLFGVEPMNSIFVRQYYEITGKNNITSLGNFPSISLKVFPPINGIWSAYLIGNNEVFEDEYFEKYQSWVEACSANLYDGLDMIIKAFETTEPRQGESIPNNADVLQTVKDFGIWNGAVGKASVERTGIMHMEVPVRVYKDGKWIKIEE